MNYYGIIIIIQKTEGLTNKPYIDFMDILLTAEDDTGSGLTRAEIRAEIDTLLFAGNQRQLRTFLFRKNNYKKNVL